MTDFLSAYLNTAKKTKELEQKAWNDKINRLHEEYIEQEKACSILDKSKLSVLKYRRNLK